MTKFKLGRKNNWELFIILIWWKSGVVLRNVNRNLAAGEETESGTATFDGNPDCWPSRLLWRSDNRLIIVCIVSKGSFRFPTFSLPQSLRSPCAPCNPDQSSSFLIPSSEEPERGQNIIGCNFPVNHVKIVKCRVNTFPIQLSTKFRESFFTIRDPYYLLCY